MNQTPNFDAQAVAKRLRDDEGFHNVSVEPSAVQGSLHDYIYVYLTPAQQQGRYAIISELSEYEPGSSKLLVGLHNHFEKPAVSMEEVPTVDEAIWRTKELLG